MAGEVAEAVRNPGDASYGIRHDPGQDRSLHLCGGRAGRTGEGPQRGLSGSTYRCGCAGRLSREAVYANCRLKGPETHMKRRIAALVALASMTTAITAPVLAAPPPFERSEEHTSELQSLMRISYAVFCLKKK